MRYLSCGIAILALALPAGADDPLPEGARARIGSMRLRHGGAVRAVVFARDGRTLASAGDDGLVSVWDAESGRELVRCRGHEGPVRGLVLLGDGRTLASGGDDGTVRLWDVTGPRDPERPVEGREIHVFRPEGGEVEALSAAGSLLGAGTGQGKIVLWEMPGRKERLRVTQEGGAYVLALAPGGKTFVTSGSPQGLRVWDATTGKVLREPGREVPAAAAFAPEGRTLAAGDFDNRLTVWKVGTGEVQQALEGHRRVEVRRHNGVFAVAFSTDGKRIASGGADGTVRVWDAAAGKEMICAEGHFGHVRAVAFSPDGKRLASGGADGSVRLWDAASGRQLSPTQEPGAPLTGLSVSPDGKSLATVSAAGRVALWDTMSGRPRAAVKGMPVTVALAAFLDEGRALALATPEGELQVWDLAAGRDKARHADRPRPMELLVASPDGRALASYGPDYHVDIWDDTGALQVRVGLLAVSQKALAFSADGKSLAATGTGGAISVWDSATGMEQSPHLQGGPASPLAVAFVPGRRALVCATADGALMTWERSTGLVRRQTQAGLKATAAAFSADGRFAAIAGRDGAVRLWRLADGVELAVLPGHRGAVRALAFAADGSVLVSGGFDGTALTWRLEGRLRDAPARKAEDLDHLWRALGSEDAGIGGEAIEALVRAPALSLPLLRDKLRPAATADVPRLVAQLDDDDFATREKATQDLVRLGRAAEFHLRKALKDEPTPELRRRIEALLAKLPDKDVAPPAPVQLLRALEVLEALNTKESRQVLETLASGPVGSPLTAPAREALGRLGSRP